MILPEAVTRELAVQLGSAVQAFSVRRGGFTGGGAGVVTLANGDTAFVKTETVPGEDSRAGAAVAAALPPGVPAPRLRFQCQVEKWVVTCYDVAPGRLPHEPWRPGELAAALDLLTTCARELTPTPLDGLPTLAERMAGRCELWNDPPDHLGPWERAHLDRLAAVERTWTALVTGDTLLHFDPRYDNVLIDERGTARLVDWGRACTGPAWADLVCLLLESDLGAPDPEAVFTGHPLGAAAPTEAVDALLVALAGYWTRTAALPGPARLRGRQEHSRRATIGWLRTRWASDSCKKPEGGNR